MKMQKHWDAVMHYILDHRDELRELFDMMDEQFPDWDKTYLPEPVRLRLTEMSGIKNPDNIRKPHATGQYGSNTEQLDLPEDADKIREGNTRNIPRFFFGEALEEEGGHKTYVSKLNTTPPTAPKQRGKPKSKTTGNPRRTQSVA